MGCYDANCKRLDTDPDKEYDLNDRTTCPFNEPDACCMEYAVGIRTSQSGESKQICDELGSDPPTHWEVGNSFAAQAHTRRWATALAAQAGRR